MKSEDAQSRDCSDVEGSQRQSTETNHSCKQSGVQWLGNIPTHWEIAPLKRLIDIRNGRDHKTVEQDDGYPVIGSGGPFAFASEYLYDGEAVLIGRKGTIDRPLHVKGRFWTVDTMYWSKIRSGVCGRFAYYVATTIPFSYYSTSTALPSITKGALDANPVALPPFLEQKAIADFLDCETARIDLLIEKKQRFLNVAKARVDALVDYAISDGELPKLRFENVADRQYRPVDLSEHDELVRLGLYNRGRGIFKKPAADEEGMGDSNFHFVQKGDLVLSGQFAWEGAVALATEEEDGCVVSHRYPVYRAKEGINTAYLLGVFRSDFGDFLLNQSSHGSAGRNRPLNTWRLGKEKLPIPSMKLQLAVDQALKFERELKNKTEQSISLLNEAKAALIKAAVTGQIDVTTYYKQGRADRRLDEIEEAMQA